MYQSKLKALSPEDFPMLKKFKVAAFNSDSDKALTLESPSKNAK